ncbi:MAG: hypothetical protein Q9167_001359 [Letrouitia subvulpina]
MHRSNVNLWHEGLLPANLYQFLYEPSLLELDKKTSEPPKKKRKVTKANEIEGLDKDDLAENYITLATIDITLGFATDSVQSRPPPKHGKESFISIKGFEKIDNTDKFHLRIATIDGSPLLESQISGYVAGDSFEMIQKVVSFSKPISKKTSALCLCGLFEDTDYNESNNRYSLQICARILLPNATSLLENTAFDRNLVSDLCGTCIYEKEKRPWKPRDFYDSVFVPRKSEDTSHFPTISELKSDLYPFQKRSVNWMLRREGVSASNADNSDKKQSDGFIRTRDANDEECWASPFLGIVTRHKDLLQLGSSKLTGGILSEEMGLGKTVEMIALICLHKAPYPISTDNSSGSQGYPATLIITPPSILHQWSSELERLAPDLRVTKYEGLRHHSSVGNEEEHVLHFHRHNVVLTTYNVLAQEIHYSGDAPDRNLRHEKKYKRRLSPLTRLKWWRVVLDEAQMIESGVSNAAKVARLVPRQNAWCVSGTPVRKTSQDLRGLLIFLRFEPYCQSAQLWDRLIRERRDVFRQLFGNIALRHTKDQIRDEIVLPTQKRIVITVPFTPIEEQHYATIFSQMCEDCGLDANGNPLTDSWDPNAPAMIEKMRSWLTRLRQTCLHAEVGRANRRALGSRKGPLRMVSEVLEVMIEQNFTACRTEERALLVSLARKGQVLEQAKRAQDALGVWSTTLEESKLLVSDARARLGVELGGDSPTNKDLSEDTVITHIGVPRQRLRAALELEHILNFFVANAYFQIKSNEQETEPQSVKFHELEKLEEDHYEKAKLIRKEMLVDTQKKADSLMTNLRQKRQSQSFLQGLGSLFRAERGGIESQRILGRLQDLAAVINGQAKQIDEWKEAATKLLLVPLVDEEEKDIRGDEYEISTQEQDKVYSYVDALRALVADFSDVISGQQNMRIEHEVRVAFRQAQEGGGHSPELLKQLLLLRQKLKPAVNLGSLRGVVTELRELRNSLRGQLERGSTRAGAELNILNSTLKDAQSMLTTQTKAAATLEKDVELLTDTMNSRLEYYRQLQHISDTVAPLEEDLGANGVETALSNYQETEKKIRSRIATLKSRSRYLENLREEATKDSPRLCTICQQAFEVGTLTSCGHSYCMECLRLWWNSHRTCPTCKKHLSRNDFYSITYKPQELTMQEETQVLVEPARQAENSSPPAIYSDIHRSTLNEIKNIEVNGSFGTKVDSLARHILWLREHDSGSKSIVFSQFRDFLDILARAFDKFKIKYTSIDKNRGIQKFKDDPGIECFFLHAKAHSSGLNLVVATHVFLCEPLINTAIELQAVARVHRIGQHQQTTVWMYLVDDTVEKSIYDISLSRRMAHMGQANGPAAVTVGTQVEMTESKIDAANTFQLEEAALDRLLSGGASGGEMVDQDDLWSCLFRKNAQRSIQAGSQG